MAEGYLRALGGDRFTAESAGTDPAAVNPLAVQVMAESGIDISRQRSKSVSTLTGQSFDWVITVCDNARESCPVFPGTCQKIHWPLEDPARAQGTDDEKLPVFRTVRDRIHEHIRAFLTATPR